MRILVTGASGYVGSRVIPRLLREGHEVRASFTDPAKATRYGWAEHCEIVTMDMLDARTVRAAVAGQDAVLYLVHSMSGDGFTLKDHQAATTMAAFCAVAGVERIVYLSGIVPPVPENELSEHIASRLDVERVLGGTGVRTITLRAAVVVGAGSTSFEIIRQISERMPVQAVPDWMDSRVQPIAVTDVLEAIVGALTVDAQTRHYDIAGPDALAYTELLRRYAEVAHITRPQVGIPGLPSNVVGMLAASLVDVPRSTVQALIESLHHDMVADPASAADAARDLLPPGHRLVGLRESFERALAKPDETTPVAERDPLGPMPFDPAWAGGQGGGLASAVAGAQAIAHSIKDAVTP